METFIVRIYRGIPTSARELAGTVERVGSGDRVGFSGEAQLLACLHGGQRADDGDDRTRKRVDATAPDASSHDFQHSEPDADSGSDLNFTGSSGTRIPPVK